MKSIFRGSWARLAFGTALVLLLGLGLVRLVDALNDDQLPPIGDPDAGLTDAQREANYAEARLRDVAERAAWRAEWVAAGHDPRALPQVELNAISEAPAESLAAAVLQADLMVLVTVESVDYLSQPLASLATVTVEQVLKGTAGAQLRVIQPGGPEMGPGGTFPGVYLVAPGHPPLFAGDRAVLALQAAGEPGLYHVQTGGQFRVFGSVVEAVVADVPYRVEIAALSLDELLARISALAR